MLQRFVENFSTSLEYYHLIQKRTIAESEINKIDEMVKDNRLSEAVSSYLEKSNVTNLKGRNVYRFPISRYDNINANGRKYEKRLWQRVINEQQESYRGNSGLADHPGDEEDGQFKHTGVVWLDMGLDEANQVVWGECVFVGPYGKLAEEVLEVGGRIGFSSSGLGELEESDKSTVRWDTYQLERPADIVLNPSQSVYGTWEMKLPNQDSAITKESKKESIQENVEEIKEKVMSEATKISKLEEKRILRDIEKFYDEAMEIADPQSRLEELQDLALPFNENAALGNSAIKEKITTAIEGAKAEISKAIKEHVKIKETFDVDNADDIKEGLKKIAIDTQLFEREAADWKAIAEGLQEKVKELQATNSTLPTVEAYNTALLYSKKLKDSFKVKESELRQEMSRLSDKLAEANKSVKALNETKVELEGKVTALTDKNKEIKEYALKLRAYINEVNENKKIEAANRKKVEEKKMEVNFHPTGEKSVSGVLSGYAESAKIEDYYNDLEERHGKIMESHKESILGCKTLKEAMKIYTGILANMDVSKTVKLSEAFDPEERKRIIEAQTQKRIKTNSTLKLPPTWE